MRPQRAWICRQDRQSGAARGAACVVAGRVAGWTRWLIDASPSMEAVVERACAAMLSVARSPPSRVTAIDGPQPTALPERSAMNWRPSLALAEWARPRSRILGHDRRCTEPGLHETISSSLQASTHRHSVVSRLGRQLFARQRQRKSYVFAGVALIWINERRNYFNRFGITRVTPLPPRWESSARKRRVRGVTHGLSEHHALHPRR